ncbi:MAG: hypothetical protein ACRDJL_08700 [Actinomycetota bacterium]
MGVAACVVSLVVGLVSPALAVPPERDSVALTNVVQDNGEACGFPVRWDIDLTIDITNFFDRDGELERVHLQIRELNTVTNLDTGLTLQEGPDAFIQRNLFNDDGSVTIEANGLSVNVRGEEQLKDVGRFVVRIGPGEFEVVMAAGPHPVRELSTGAVTPELLAAFCEVLS